MIRRFAFLFLLSFPPLALRATEVPYLSKRVTDAADVLSATTIQDLERRLKAHEDSTSNQVAVLTIASLEGEALEAFSIRVVDTWKLGQKERDNGVLLLVVTQDRKVRIEVGRGLEGSLPDITCGTIIRKDIVPRFKEGDYDGGVAAGVDGILRAIRGEYTADPDTPESEDLAPMLIGTLLFVVVVGVFTLLAIFMRGGATWFLYLFLMPFWFAFPAAMYGFPVGVTLFSIYAVGFLILKFYFSRTAAGKAFHERWAKKTGTWSTSSGGWSSGGGGSSSGGSSFSGGGGGFSGGGASGSW
jgi:uncharacterized protein